MTSRDPTWYLVRIPASDQGLMNRDRSTTVSGKPAAEAVPGSGRANGAPRPRCEPGTSLCVRHPKRPRDFAGRAFGLIAVVTATVLAVASARAQDVVTIGFTASRTGALADESLAQVRGFELWREEVNAAGGLKVGARRHKIEFKNHDDESQTVRVQELYGRLITQDKVQFLFGPVSSGLNAMAAFVSEENGKVMLTTATDPKLFRLGNRSLFQVTSPSSRSFAGALAVLKARDPQPRIALLFKDDPFTRSVAQATRDLVKAEGVTVVLDETYSPTAGDFAGVAGKIQSMRATALLGGGHVADGLALLRAVRERSPDTKWLTLLMPAQAAEVSELGDAALGVTAPVQWLPQVAYKPDVGPTAQVFDGRFREKFKTPPTELAAAGYAAGLVLGHAIEKAASTDPARVTATLNRLEVTTLFGVSRFASEPREHGLQIGHEMVLRQWQRRSGQVAAEVVWPSAVKTADIAW